MAYRDDVQAAAARVAALERELEEARRKSVDRIAALLVELEDARRVLDRTRPSAHPILLVAVVGIIGVALPFLAVRLWLDSVDLERRVESVRKELASAKPAPPQHHDGLCDSPVSAPRAPLCDDGHCATLDKHTIVVGMKRVSDRVTACYKRYNIPGLANVETTIANDGTILDARTTGMFADTPTGRCVEAAVRAATFPKFAAQSQTITYPFMLR
jgi:hypothetical protein